jgi:hypothetical protein
MSKGKLLQSIKDYNKSLLAILDCLDESFKNNLKTQSFEQLSINLSILQREKSIISKSTYFNSQEIGIMLKDCNRDIAFVLNEFKRRKNQQQCKH